MKIISQLLLTVLMCFCINASAQQLTYKAVNPNFGGNYLNYSWLMSSANAQNPFDNKENSSLTSNLLSSFSDSMKRQILNQLTRSLFSGSDGGMFPSEGSIEIGGLIITIEDIRNGTIITIIDSETGESTEIIL
jgi:curli production assembly/transport component CsgF